MSWRFVTRDRLISLFTPIALLALWEFGARVGWIDTRFFSSPALIGRQFLVLSQSGEIWSNTAISLQRLGIGNLDAVDELHHQHAPPISGQRRQSRHQIGQAKSRQ